MTRAKCRDCDKICKVNDKALKCSACSEWLHITCTNVSEVKYQLVSDLMNLSKEEGNEEDDYHWYCKFCNKKVTDMTKLLGSIDKRLTHLDNEVQAVKQDLDDVKDEVGKKCDEEKVKELIDMKLQDNVDKEMVKKMVRDEVTEHTEASAHPGSSDAVSQSVREMEDRSSRKGNFILFHAPESDSILKEDVNKNNVSIVTRILEKCGVELDEEITATHVLRLGNKGGKNRPILVIMNDLDAKRKLFKEFDNKITKGNDDDTTRIKLAHDLTKLQREEENVLLAKVRELNGQFETTGKKYKIRGPSWDRKLVELRQ